LKKRLEPEYKGITLAELWSIPEGKRTSVPGLCIAPNAKKAVIAVIQGGKSYSEAAEEAGVKSRQRVQQWLEATIQIVKRRKEIDHGNGKEG
jgi:hypothetical protein